MIKRTPGRTWDTFNINDLLRAELFVWRNQTMKRRRCSWGPCTFHDLLGVVGEELAERRFLGPLQSVEQLLDLGGHSAADRDSCGKE